MNLNRTEQFVLAMIAIGMLQAGYSEGSISKSQFESYSNNACAKLSTSTNIIFSKIDVNPFIIIRQMDSQKKNFVKSFLYEILQMVPNSESATYYFISTLEQGGLISNK